MVNALDPELSSLGLMPGQGRCVVLGKTCTYLSHCPLHPGVQMGTSKLLARVNLWWTRISHYRALILNLAFYLKEDHFYRFNFQRSLNHIAAA